MAADSQEILIPLAAASHQSPRLNLLILEPPSSSVSPPSPSNAGGAQHSHPKMLQNSVIKNRIDNGSDESDELSFGSLWEWNWHKFRSKSGAGTGNNVATAHATSGVSRLPQPLRAARLDYGDGSGGTKTPPKDVIVISSDDESSDDESYDDEFYDDESSDDKSSDEQQKSGPGCLPAPSSISRTAPSTRLSQLANGASAACQSGQASAPNDTTRNNTAPAMDAASLVEHRAARPIHGCKRDPRPSVEPYGTKLNDDDSKCVSDDERHERHFRHHVRGPRRAASDQEETPRISGGRYRSASHSDGDQTSGSAPCHPPFPDETGVPTKIDPVTMLQVQEHRASPLVLPDRQSTSEFKPADAEPRFQHQSSPSAASEHGVKTQDRSGSCTLSQHLDHHGGSNQTNDLKQGDTRLPGDRGEQGVGSSVATSQAQESGARVPRSSEVMSNKDPVLANVGPSVQPSVRPSANQNPVRLQHSLGRRPRRGTDVGENQRPADGVGEHGRGDVAQSPPPKRRRINTSSPAVGETAPERQANPHHASCRPQRARGPTTRQATPRRSQLKIPKQRSSGVASTTKQTQKSCKVEHILDFQVRYLVKWEGYGPEHNSWEPVEHFHQCPQLLEQFHRIGLVTTEPPCPSQLIIPKPRSVGGASTTKKAPRKYFDVEHILDFQVRYLVKWEGHGPMHNSWVPVGQFDQCPKLLQQFHERTGPVEELIAGRYLP